MYELTINHHRLGPSRSVHADHAGASNALTTYANRLHCARYIAETTNTYTRIELHDPTAGEWIAAAITWRPGRLP
jgi:hypothetical protein